MKIAIVGSRTYKNLDKVILFVNHLHPKSIIITGGAIGVDKTAEKWSMGRGLETIVYRAEWGKIGKSAGMIRNKDIVNNCDMLVAFWDGKSRGAKNSIDLAKKA